MDPQTQTQLAIIAMRVEFWTNTLWQAEKVDLPIAQRIGDKTMEANAMKAMRAAQTALAMLEELKQKVKEESDVSG